MPIILNKARSPNRRLVLSQEAIPEGSQLSRSKDHGVSMGTAFNHLVCAQILSFCFYFTRGVHPSMTRGICHRTTPRFSVRRQSGAIRLSNTPRARSPKTFYCFCCNFCDRFSNNSQGCPNSFAGLTPPGIEHPWLYGASVILLWHREVNVKVMPPCWVSDWLYNETGVSNDPIAQWPLIW